MNEDRRTISIVDVFTSDSFAGTPTGVVHDASGLSDEQLQAIASELEATVTGIDRSEAEPRLRSVSRAGDPCSATTAIAVTAQDDGLGDESIETPDGSRSVAIEDRVWVEGFEASIREVEAEYDRVADALGIETTALEGVGKDLPIARASIGRPYVVVPVNFFEQIGDVTPDGTAIESLCEEFSADGIAVYTFDTLERDSTVHCRAFDTARESATPEEQPASGLVGGAIGASLRRFSGIDATEVLCEQGAFLDRPGHVAVRTDEGIQVGGNHATTLSGEIEVPDVESDELIEV